MSGTRGKVSILLVIIVALASLTASCAGAPTMPMTLYENTEHGFSIEYPEGWAENVMRPVPFFYIEFSDPEGRLSAGVSLEYKTEELTLADAVSEAKTYIEAMPQFELISEGNVTISKGIPGYEIVGEGDLGTGKVERFRSIMGVREKQALSVIVRAEPADFDQQKQLIDTIVDSFKLLPTYTFVPPTPGAAGTYTSAEYGFSINHPAGWIKFPLSRPGEVVSLGSAEGFPGVMVSAEVVGEGTTLADFGAQFSQGLGEHWSDCELFSQGEIALDDGTPAYEIVFSGTTEGYTLKCKYVIVIQGSQAFFLMGYSMPDRFEQDEAAMDEVVCSFHLE